jgi:elongation factor Ts
MEITAAMVKELREKTGLPMMECKTALQESGGDMTKAIEILRKKGMAQLSKRAGRHTSEGRVLCYADPAGGQTAIVEVLCETEPVANNEDFQKLAAAAAKAAVKLTSPTAEAVLDQPDPANPAHKISDLLHDVVNRIRENIKIGRVACFSGEVGSYLHHDGKKGVLVKFSAPCPAEVKADVCMHVVAMRPPYARREDVPADVIEKEREVAKAQVKGKPDNIVDKIVTGKINKWYAEVVLLEQPFVKDDKKSVGQILREVAPTLTVESMHRFEIGDE